MADSKETTAGTAPVWWAGTADAYWLVYGAEEARRGEQVATFTRVLRRVSTSISRSTDVTAVDRAAAASISAYLNDPTHTITTALTDRLSELASVLPLLIGHLGDDDDRTGIEHLAAMAVSGVEIEVLRRDRLSRGTRVSENSPPPTIN